MSVTKADITIIVITLLSAVVIYYMVTVRDVTNNEAKTLSLMIDGIEHNYDLKNVDDVIEFEFSKGVGRLLIDGTSVKMEKMPVTICPNQICSKTGWISNPGASIVCLPNRLSVVLIGEGYVEKVDAVTW